jgi:hypothetical protein
MFPRPTCSHSTYRNFGWRCILQYSCIYAYLFILMLSHFEIFILLFRIHTLYILNHICLQTSCSKFLGEKFSTYYWTTRFTIVLKKIRHYTISWVRWTTSILILWRIWPLLSNEQVNTFPFKNMTTIVCPVLDYVSVNTFKNATMGAEFLCVVRAEII